MGKWKEQARTILSGSDTPQGRAFDIVLMVTIAVSVAVVVFDSVPSVRLRFGGLLKTIEWTVTGLFTVEYVLRLSCGPNPKRYARSFLGVIDLLAVLPSYLALAAAGFYPLVFLRALRLLRIFRILKFKRFIKQAEDLSNALRASQYKISVFLVTIVTLVLILGTLMYMIEGEASGFTSIPQSMYWAIVTITTVGYGDIAPITVPGKMIASAMMLIGYAIIAVPTGIITAEIARGSHTANDPSRCPRCHADGHRQDALYCRKCGEKLE